jgi:hypothetical protein
MRRRVWRRGTVSAVGFGAMSFGGFYGPTNEAKSMRTLARALEGPPFCSPSVAQRPAPSFVSQ